MPSLERSKFLFVVSWLSLIFFAILVAACTSSPSSSSSQSTSSSAQAKPALAVSTAAGSGVKIKIESVSIPADRKPVVTFKLTDAKDNPLGVEALDGTPPKPSFTIAKIVEADNNTHYENYFTRVYTGTAYTFQGQQKQPALANANLPTTDSGGTVADKGAGEYTYTFGQAIPQDAYNANATTVVGAYATRETRKYVSNDVYTFVPAGGDPKVTRMVSETEVCNQCHDPLAVHGGARRELGLCLTCHTPQNVDPATGNVLDMKVLVHKIHDGDNLPSVKAGNPYYIGGENHNFSDIGWPQDIRNCTTCHQKGPQADNWKNKPGAAACGSCHDDIDFKTGTNHPGGPQPDDKNCASCHPADGPEFSPSVSGAHTIPAASTQLQGLKAAIVKITDSGPGLKPTVTFTMTDGKGNTVKPDDLDSLSVTLAHPTTDYAHRTTETIRRIGAPATATAAARPDQPSKAVANSDGSFSYTMNMTVDPSWTGSLAIGMEGYRMVTIKGPQGKDTSVRESFYNPVAYAAVTDPKPVPRRQVVDRNNCNQCHKDLGNPAAISIHGGNRRNTEYCVMCHNPATTDEPSSGDKGAPVEGVQYKYFIHSLHMGDERAVATAFGDAAQAKTKDIHFPGDQSDCAKCHVKQTYTLPLPPGVLPMTVGAKSANLPPVQPIKAACLGCHISPAAVAHEDLQTTANSVESCTVCHGAGRDFAVDKVHPGLNK